jgi:hypothetical protein
MNLVTKVSLFDIVTVELTNTAYRQSCYRLYANEELEASPGLKKKQTVMSASTPRSEKQPRMLIHLGKHPTTRSWLRFPLKLH